MNKTLLKNSLIEKSREHDNSIYNLSKFKNSLALDYALNSKFTDFKIKKLAPITTQFYHPFVLERAAQPYKRYEDCFFYSFEDYVENNFEFDIYTAIKTRKSTKEYLQKDISIKELYCLLHHSYGIMRKEKIQNETVPWSFRAVPSPGGIFASEIYVILLNSHLPKGLYHYRSDTNGLELLKEGDFSGFVKENSGMDMYINSIESINGILITTGMIERLYTKYGERAYRFMLLEIGFIAQNMSLIAESLNIGTCMLGGYYDDKINEFIGIDGLLESVQNIMVFGSKKEEITKRS